MNRWGSFLAGLLAMWIVGAAALADAQEPGESDEQAPGGGTETAPHDPSPTDDAHEAAAGHDEFDLTHGNAGPQLEAPEEFKYDLAIYTMVVFLVFMTGLLKFAWRPIVAGLDKREQSIASMIDDAKQNSEKAAAQLQEYEARLATAADEARTIVAQARTDAESAAERIRTEAQQAAQRDKQRAIDEITAAKNVALQEVAAQGADVAFMLAGKIIRRDLNADDHADLVREALGQLPSKN